MDEMIFNVRDFGALPDAKTPATEAIQKAMDAAGAVNGTVEIPAGRYLCGYVKLPAGITVRGTYTWNWSYHAGFAGSIIEFCDPDAPCCFDMTDARGSTLDGLSMDGKLLGSHAHGVLVNHTEYQETDDSLKFENCRIGFFSGDSICLRYVRGFAVRHSMLCFSYGWSLYVIGGDGCVIDNWLSRSDNGGGLGLGGDAFDIRVTANRIEDTDGTDINLYVPLDGSPHVGCRNILIANNYICGSNTSGITAVNKEGAVLEDVLITGNAFDSNGSGSIDLIEGNHIQLEGCRNFTVAYNVLFTKKGFWDPTANINTTYGIVWRDCEDLLITENCLNNCAAKEALTDLGVARGELIVAGNAGREICDRAEYMFPHWHDAQYPDAKRDAEALQMQ